MIATLKGQIIESQPLKVILEVNNVGYEVNVSLVTGEQLAVQKHDIFLYIYAVYREDTQALYGFLNREEKELFQLLVEKVSGIGPKVALTIFSKFPVDLLRQAIATSDVALLAKCPGIGKKTAERLTIELKDKVFPKGSIGGVSPTLAVMESLETQAQADAISALIALGVSAKEAEKSVERARKSLNPEKISTEALIKLALG